MRPLSAYTNPTLARIAQGAIAARQVQLEIAEQHGTALEVQTLLEEIGHFERQLTALEAATGPACGCGSVCVDPSHQQRGAGFVGATEPQERALANWQAAQGAPAETNSSGTAAASTEPF